MEDDNTIYLIKLLTPEWLLLQTLWGKFPNDGIVEEFITTYRNWNPDFFYKTDISQFEEVETGADMPSDQFAVWSLQEPVIRVDGKVYRYIGEPYK
jgi:hypothetical protein